MSVFVIADPGSTHLGQLDRAKALTRIAKDAGADAIKWQLFKGNAGGNIELPRGWFVGLVEYGKNLGIEVFASAFDTEAWYIINKFCNRVKLSFSMRSDSLGCLSDGVELMVSGDVLTVFPVRLHKKIFCIPQYPVQYQIDFEGIFPRFDGFSSHCLGIEQDIRAVKAGAKIIEKHIRFGDDADFQVPDGRFALRPDDFHTMVLRIRDTP